MTEQRAARDELILALDQCVVLAAAGSLTLNQALAKLQGASYGFLGIVLCLPFLQPVSLGPLSTMAGAALLALGWQLSRHASEPQLPDRMGNYALSEGMWRALLKACRAVVVVLAWLARPRLQHWVDGPSGRRLIGVMVMIGAVLLAIPAPIIPFSNMLPALGIIFAFAAQLERDGALVLVSLVWFVLTVAYFALVAYLVFVLGVELSGWWVARS